MLRLETPFSHFGTHSPPCSFDLHPAQNSHSSGSATVKKTSSPVFAHLWNLPRNSLLSGFYIKIIIKISEEHHFIYSSMFLYISFSYSLILRINAKPFHTYTALLEERYTTLRERVLSSV